MFAVRVVYYVQQATALKKLRVEKMLPRILHET